MPSTVPKLALIVLGIAAAAYLGLCALLYAKQRSLIYFPQPGDPPAGAAVLTLAPSGTRVSVLPRPGPDAVIYLGGNAEHTTFSAPDLAAAFPRHAIYLMHYRGYAGSPGAPTEAHLNADALALFDRVHAEHARVVVIGRSLGSGIAVRLASARPASRLVLVTPYDSLQELAVRQFPYVPVRWLLQDKFESWRYAPQVAVPTTLVMAEHDEVIPRSSTERLLTRFGAGVARLTVIPAAGHNTLSANPLYLAALRGEAAPPGR